MSEWSSRKPHIRTLELYSCQNADPIHPPYETYFHAVRPDLLYPAYINPTYIVERQALTFLELFIQDPISTILALEWPL
jgi:hypothetical protein